MAANLLTVPLGVIFYLRLKNGEKHGHGGKEADSVLSSPDENLFPYLKITYFQRGHLLVCQSPAALERITL